MPDFFVLNLNILGWISNSGQGLNIEKRINTRKWSPVTGDLTDSPNDEQAGRLASDFSHQEKKFGEIFERERKECSFLVV